MKTLSEEAGVKAQVVGIGDCKVTAGEGAELVTYALGSCIAVAVWDPAVRVGGLLHFMLPDSTVDRQGQGRDHPYRYADTGVPLLFREAYQQGADKRRLVVRLAGGAAVVNDNGLFSIGKRNYAALRKILWRAGVLVHAEDVGGTLSRTVRLEIGSGRMLVRTAGQIEKELAAGPAAARVVSPTGGAVCQNA